MTEIKCETCRYMDFSKDDEPCEACGDGLNWEAKEPVIKDSGERREFESGAVRDCAEGKGRCDLLPLDVVAHFLNCPDGIVRNFNLVRMCGVYSEIETFMRTHRCEFLFRALDDFAVGRGWDYCSMVLDLSKHYEEGAKKYKERNWEKGIPAHCYVDSAVRHLLKYMRGDTDEPHDRAFVWNIFGLIWTMKHKPECDDLPGAEKEEADETEN